MVSISMVYRTLLIFELFLETEKTEKKRKKGQTPLVKLFTKGV